MVAPTAALVERRAQPTGNSPELPRSVVDTRLPALSGRVLRAARSGDLQRALDGARPGDQIVLSPGVTYAGNFRLRRYVGDGWVVIRPDLPESKLPAPGSRATPGSTSLPRIVTPNANPALAADAGAAGYRIIGVEVGAAPSVTTAYSLVALGEGDKSQNSLDRVPRRIILDRVIVRGHDTLDVRRGVALNGAELAVIDSWIAGIHSKSDAAAVWGWNGPGPFRIEGNRLEGSGENIMFGGSDPRIADLVPADIEIRRNLLTKRVSWKAAKVPVKNAFELKSGRRVLVEGNVFENVWTSGQDGTAIVLKSTNQDGRCTQCVTEYVTFQNNIVRNAASGLLINAAETGKPGAALPERVNHVRIHNVLFLEIGLPEWGTGGKLFRIFGGVSDVSIQHVTSTSNPRGILDARDSRDANPNLVFGYNLVERRWYGIGAGGDEGVPTLGRNFPQAVYKQNVIVNTSQSTDQAVSDSSLKAKYPPQTMIARGWEEVAFQSGTYRLSPGSPFKRAADDGRDIGIDWDALEKAQSGAGGSGPCGRAIPRPK